MDTITELFQREGTIVSVEGNKPLLLTDPNNVWLVERGKAAVFSIQIKDNEATGVRSYLFEVEAHNILFGICPESVDQSFGLLVTGVTGTSFRRISRTLFMQGLEQAVDKTMYLDLINYWLMSFFKQEEIEPLTTESEELGLLLNKFHQLALGRIKARYIKQQQIDKIRFQDKRLNNEKCLDNAIHMMASITKKEQQGDTGEFLSDTLLSTACKLVGHAMKIEIISPPSLKQETSKDPLGDIARASMVRTRQVILSGEWWKTDSGPLLAFLEENNQPVALLPLSPNQYQLHNPANKSITLVNYKISQQIKPMAFTFYRSFPAKVLKSRDILSFSLGSCWRRDLIIVVLMGLLGGLLGTVTPIATGIVFDSIIPEGEKTQLMQVAFFLVAIAFATMLFQLTRSLAMLRMEGKMDGSVQAAVWDRLLSLSVPFFKQYSAGELAMRAMGISQIRSMLSGVTITTILSSIFSCFNLFLLFYYDVKLAVVATGLILVAIVMTFVQGYIQISYKRQLTDIVNRISGLVLQLIGGVVKFRVAGAEGRAFYQWSKEFSKQKKVAFKSKNIANGQVLFDSVYQLVTSMIIFYVMITFSQESLGAGKFIAFNSAFASLMGSMISLAEVGISILDIVPLYERAKPILEALPEYDENMADPGQLTGSIEVSHVSFRYKEDGPLVLKDVSLQIKEGEYIGLVGTSGSGKSTLFRILLGFEKPEAGRVYYNGQDLGKVDIRAVRKQLGVVLQNGQLMTGDIYSNIVGANPNLTIDDAWAAAKMAGLDQDIREMPMGMHTVISEGAGTFSGGQKQRLLIARAIVKKPRIIYFDEATSALDNRTQAIVSESLDKLKATRVVIAHRLSTIVTCNRIIVLDQGRIIETGTYEQLMQQDGVFATLAKRQLA